MKRWRMSVTALSTAPLCEHISNLMHVFFYSAWCHVQCIVLLVRKLDHGIIVYTASLRNVTRCFIKKARIEKIDKRNEGRHGLAGKPVVNRGKNCSNTLFPSFLGMIQLPSAFSWSQGQIMVAFISTLICDLMPVD